MKIGVISDTHIPDRADKIPAAVLAAFKGVDMIVHAGDMVEVDVLDKLKLVCKNVVAVSGNMDPLEIKKKYPEKQVFTVGKFKVGLAHGWGSRDQIIDVLMEYFKNDLVDLVIFGHAHCVINEKRGDVLFFNPGSPTDKMFCEYNSYGIIEIGDKIEATVVKL